MHIQLYMYLMSYILSRFFLCDIYNLLKLRYFIYHCRWQEISRINISLCAIGSTYNLSFLFIHAVVV